MSNSITDLTNTGWKLNSTISAPSGYGDFYIDHSISLPDGTTASDQKRFAVGYGLHNWWGLTPTQDNIISFKKLYFIEDVLPALESEYALSTGDIIKITGGQDVTNASLISWLSENAQQVFDSECSFDYDDFWIQKDCHWDYDRIFTVTTKIKDSGSPYFYYKLGPKDDSILNYTEVEPNDIRIKGNTYTYDLKLSKLVEDFGLSNLLNNRSDDGWLTITALVRINGQPFYFEYVHFLELAPVMEAPKEPNTNVVQTSLVNDKPGELFCSWPPADTLEESDASYSPDSLDGYCIELYRCLADSEEFEKLNGLALETTTKVNDLGEEKVYYKLIRTEDSAAATISENDDEIVSYVGLGDSYEVYLDFMNEDNVNLVDEPKFYFEPAETDFNKGHSLRLNRGDKYKFIIYPYSHYEGALITSAGAESDIKEVPKGIVRVKTADRWVEGEVWVYASTSKGHQWVRAEAIYTNTTNGWVEAQ